MSKKSKSIREHIVLPILVIMLLQAVLFLVSLLYGNVAKNLRSNSVEILNEYTMNGKLYLEKEIVHRWIKEVENTDSLNQTIENFMERNQYELKDIKSNPQVNRELVAEIMPQVIDLLHRSYATGVFIILDGPPAVNSQQDVMAGVYLRDLNPNNYAQDNSDLLFERGLPSLANDYEIALDSFWELGFDFADRTEDMDFFFKPYESAAAHQIKAGEENNFGYMSAPFSLHPLDTEVISYSKPLVIEGVGIIGVVGLDMTLTQVQSFMKSDKLDKMHSNINVLGIRKEGSSEVEKAATTGPMFSHYWGDTGTLSLQYDPELDIYNTSSEDGEHWFASISPLDIYNHNTPFENEEWVFMNISMEHEVLQFYDKMREMILISLFVPLVLGTVCVVITGRMLAQPIRKLVIEMREKKKAIHLKLTRVNIEEIDELAEAIESLSNDVAESSSKISNILNNVNIPIGVFEYKEKQNRVFCSRSLFEIMNWETIEENYTYVDTDEFLKRMENVALEKVEKEQNVFFVDGPSPRWYRLKSTQKNGEYLGVITDISAEMMERKKLEKERDFDLLTSLYNRRGFRDRVSEYMENGDMPAAMVMWDLDNLKYINDTYGHDEGDRYIVTFAKQLSLLEKDGGFISRYAGDEFLTFLYAEDGKDRIRKRLNQFMESLKASTMEVKGGYRIPLRVSAGVAWYPDDAGDYDLLVSYADFAMYMVKHNMKGIILEFDKEQYHEDSYLLAGKEELNQILEEKNIKFAFQPIIDSSGELYGYELLMRPKAKKLKSVSELLNLAKSQAKLNQMESLTWTEGLKSAKSMIESGHLKPSAYIFINSIPNARITDEETAAIEAEYHDILHMVVIELTEGEPMSEPYLNYKQKAAGRWNAQMAIDDYGSGYNSESVLLEMKPDFVKLDMSLVRNIDKERTRRQLVQSMIDFAKDQGIKVLAEGVETSEEFKVLKELKVDLYQGYYIGRPDEEIKPINPHII